MFESLKNLKLVQKLKNNESPKYRLADYAHVSELDRSTTDYLEQVTGVDIDSDLMQLETMVRAQLREEFPNIESKSNYEQLVQAVMLNLKKKNINCIDDLDKD